MAGSNAQWYKSKKSGKKFPYSSYVDIKRDDARNMFIITINNPGENMQSNMANFESLALMCRCVDPGCTVEIDFKLKDWTEKRTINNVKTTVIFKGWNGEFGQKTPGSNAYLRFLYRAAMFKKAFSWVEFSKESKCEIKRFWNEILKPQIKPTNNIPNRQAEYNKNKGMEHITECKLANTEEGNKYLNELYKEYLHSLCGDTSHELVVIKNQLPNGLFDGDLSKSCRIFTTGFYDIWAIDSRGDFCIFELKQPGNDQLGIISELFFYAAYAQDVLMNIERLHKPAKLNFRGYEELFQAVEKSAEDGEKKGIRAIFLLPQGGGHKSIKNYQVELLGELNKNELKIQFGFIFYDPQRVCDIKESFYNEVLVSK